MKTYSNEMPLSILPLGDGNYHYNYNVATEQVTDEQTDGSAPETRTQYVYDTVFVAGEPTVGKIVAAVVHESYTDEDIALMTAMHQAAEMGIGDEPEGYEDYLSLVVATRAAAAEAMAEFNARQ